MSNEDHNKVSGINKESWIDRFLFKLRDEAWKYIFVLFGFTILWVFFKFVLSELAKLDFGFQNINQWYSFGICVALGVMFGYSSCMALLSAKYKRLEVERNNRVTACIGSLGKTISEQITTSLEKVHAIPDIASQLQTDHSIWVRKATDVLAEAKKGPLSKMWLSEPWQYIDRFREVNISHQGDSNSHIKQVSLYGTMVGFAFLLPEPLRNLICQTELDLQQINIITSDAAPMIDESCHELVHYPLCLATSLLQLIIEGKSCKHIPELMKNTGKTLEICIYYLPHDLLTAAIHFGEEEIILLQAFDFATFRQVIAGNEEQKGVRYRSKAPSDEERAAYRRYQAVLGNIMSSVKSGLTQNSGIRCEKWTLAGTSNGFNLCVENPHWKWRVNGSSPTVTLLLTSDDYEKEGTAHTVNIQSGPSEPGVEEFLTAMMQALTTQGQSHTQVRELRKLVMDKRIEWAEKYKFKCACKSTPKTTK